MNRVSTRDPARADFWDERFAKGFIPGTQRACRPSSHGCRAARDNCSGPSVLVPGCGSAYEV